MAAVKGKIRICQSSIGDFNVELINGSAFYKRYVEFMRVFQKHIHEYSPDIIFAQPEENAVKGTIDWYIPAPDGVPTPLDSLKEMDLQEYQYYADLRIKVIEYLKNIEQQISSAQEKQYFACALKYLDSEYAEQLTYCYDDKISFAVWGMGVRKGRSLETVITDDVKEHRVHTVSYVVEGNGSIKGNASILRKHGHLLQGTRDIPEIIPAKHFSFTEWIPCAPQGKPVNEDTVYTAVCARTDDYQIDFIASEGGTIVGNTTIMKKPGEMLTETELPAVIANDGYMFSEWSPNLDFDKPIEDDEIYTAIFIKDDNPPVIPPVPPIPPSFPEMPEVRFFSGENGILKGDGVITVPLGTTLAPNQIPSVKANRGYTFAGWDKPLNNPINENTTFTALYDKKIPWYRRFWLWLTGSGCLKWLLWLLLFLLCLFLFLFFMRSCVGCSGFGWHSEENGVVPVDSVKRSNGRIVDDNGYVRPITGDDGILPEDGDYVAPVLGEDGDEPPIIKQPGVPDVIGNRLFLFLEDENDNVDALAQDFKKAYPGDKYNIIGFDREVKLLVIQIPEAERDHIRQTINQKIPNHKFIVFDEEIYELHGTISSGPQDPGWHLKAIHLQQGWQTTKGSESVKVAVVDDGIEASHPIFKGRIVDAYNVFTQNNKLSLGDGHGTHTAGLAVGSAEFYSKGASGVAPNCKLMPIQVFDNKMCPLSALVAGVMYAIHHDADVVNLSVGPSFKGLNQLPVEAQEQIAQNQFKNVEKLWIRVCKLAAKKKCILVFAAGNDDILSSIPPENRNSSALVVTAVDKSLNPTEFTNYGPCSDISAPGSAIYSSYPRGTFQSFDGTSMAAPIVSGTIALMKSLKKDLTVEQARNVLFKSGAEVKGNIPPMVLVDQALLCVKKGDFSAPAQGEKRPVSDEGNVSIDVPAREIVVPAKPSPSSPSGGDNTTDYDEIRRLIKEYEKKIKDLKKQLPENK